MAPDAKTTRILPPHFKPTLEEVLDALHERHKEEIRAIVRRELGGASDGMR